MAETSVNATPDPSPLTRDEVRAEVGRAMHDPTHPQYQHFRRGGPNEAAQAWMDSLYARMSEEPTPAPSIEGSGQLAAATGPVEAQLRARWGAEHDTVKASVRATADYLFGAHGGLDGPVFEAMEANLLDHLAHRPEAEARGHVLFGEYLRDVGQLRQGAGATSTPLVDDPALTAGISAALGPHQMAAMQASLAHLFRGPDGAATFAALKGRVLGGLSAEQQMAVAVRTARWLVAQGRLS